jgi:hypothetical protein
MAPYPIRFTLRLPKEKVVAGLDVVMARLLRKDAADIGPLLACENPA